MRRRRRQKAVGPEGVGVEGGEEGGGKASQRPGTCPAACSGGEGPSRGGGGGKVAGAGNLVKAIKHAWHGRGGKARGGEAVTAAVAAYLQLEYEIR